MWFWGRSEALPDEAVRDIQKKCAPVRRAYASCLKSNQDRPEPCRGLEVRLLESYAKHCCPEDAAKFRDCYEAVFAGEVQDMSVCEPHIAAMKKCLKRKGLGYPLV